MIEDKLLREERIRLESLTQAIQSLHLMSNGRQNTAENIVQRAETFEKFIKGTDDKDGT